MFIKIVLSILSAAAIFGIAALVTDLLNGTTRKGCGPYERFVKRPLDMFLAIIALMALSPVMLITMLLVRVKLGAPVFFKQERPGRDERSFFLIKFRSMTNARDEEGNLLPDDVRLTRFGRLLRSTSLDELPELFNIIKGDMSLVGPRPLLKEYLPYYTEEEHHRHDVRPGLTGWAQVNGRNAISWDRKLQYDIEYVERITFLRDVKICLLTVVKTIKRSDIQVGSGFKAGKFIDQRKDRIKDQETAENG